MYVCMYISNKLQYQLMFFAGLYRVSLFLFQYTALSHCFSHFSSRYLSQCAHRYRISNFILNEFCSNPDQILRGGLENICMYVLCN